jgi:hypothetical protein
MTVPMTYQLIIASPLLVAAILMAVRFVGCTQDFDQFDPQPGSSLPSSYSGAVSDTDGLVSFWQLNDGSPPTARDSKDGNNGTYQPGVTTQVPGLVSANAFELHNLAAAFDGKTGYVTVPFASNLNPPKAFSVEALVKPAANDQSTQVIVSSGGGYRLTLAAGAFEASLVVVAGSQPAVVVFPGEQGMPYQEGPPYYVAMTYDGATLSLYVNPAATGDQATFQATENPGNSRFNSAPSDYQPATSNDLRIGASADGDTPAEFFAGLLQDVAVYDRALDFKDIVSHYWIFASGYPAPQG